MQNRGLGIAIAAIGVIAAVVLFVAFSGGEDSDEQASVPTIVVEGGEPVGGVQELTFTEGEDIRFVVKSDVADGVHFHGYDIEKEVEAAGEVEFNVPATITGLFEVELEERVVPIAEIAVSP